MDKFSRVSLFALLAAAVVHRPALAQEAAPAAHVAPPEQATTVSDIIVTARRVNESLQKVPASITVVDTAQIRELNLRDISSLERVSPAFTFVASSRGAGSPTPMIRGQRTTLSGLPNDPAVVIYFGEVGQSFSGGSNSALFDLASVQVIKGPVGTLFGRNATGGAILLTPNAPTDEFEGYGQITGGNRQLRDLEGVINAPLGDGLSLRIAAKSTRRDGYMHNVFNGRDGMGIHSDAERFSLRWNPNAKFETTTIMSYADDTRTGASRLAVLVPVRVTAAALPLLAAAQARIANLGRYQYESNDKEFSRSKGFGLQNITQYNIDSSLDDLDVKNIIGYRDTQQDALYDVDGTASNILSSRTRSTPKMFSEEFQVHGRAGSLQFLGGLYYYHLKGEDTTLLPTFVDLFSVAPTTFPVYSYTDVDFKTDSYALFGHVDYQLTDQLSLSAGARYTKDDRSIVFHNRASTTPSLGLAGPFRCSVTGVIIPSNDRSACSTPASTSFKKFTFDGTLNWQLDPNVLLYGAFRRGYRPGSFSTSPTSVALIPAFIFQPETNDEFELGLKSRFTIANMPVRFNAAAYYDKLSNTQRQLNATAPGPNNTTIFVARVVNAASEHVYGGEAELTINPTDALTISAGGSIIKPKYDEFVDFYTVNGVPTPVDVSDSDLSFVPHYMGAVTVSYKLPVPTSIGGFTFGLNYAWRSGFQTTEITTSNCGPNGQYTGCLGGLGKLKGYSIANVRLDWHNVFRKGFDLAAYVNNVADKYYVPYLNNTIASTGYGPINVGEPRMFGVELRVPIGADSYSRE